MVPRDRRPNGSNGKWAIKKVIEIPAEPADPEKLPPLLQGFKAVAPLVTDINLSLDDRYLYVSCWGTGEFIQYDVTDPFNPKKISSFRLGGIVSRAAHPSKPAQPLNGGPQMVEISRDGKRIYFTNGLYTPVGRAVLSGRRPRLDGQGRMCDPKAAWSWTRSSSWRPTACARTRCAWKAATLRPIRTATHRRKRGARWLPPIALGPGSEGCNLDWVWAFRLAPGPFPARVS